MNTKKKSCVGNKLNGKIKKGNSLKSENKQRWKGADLLSPLLMKIIRMEFVFVQQRIQFDRRIRVHREAEREIEGLFDKAYKLYEKGRPQQEIESVLQQIIPAGKGPFFKSHTQENEGNDDSG
ncbi:MAG: hypothetical protein NTZ17_03595 [Phycisphaerae bacterium]|nr:hypothetical protein [Phycisphaerae bacterium]